MRRGRIITLCVVIAIMIMLSMSVLGHAALQKPANYPKKPIHFIVTFSAGGGTDVGFRILCQYAEKIIGVPIVVVNKPGGGGEVGMVELVRSKPDGYTIGNFNSAHTTILALREAKYSLDDVEPICLAVSDPRLFIVRADDDRFKTIEDFLEYGRKHPGKLTVGTSGAGTTGHFQILAVNKFANTSLQPVHYGGAGESKAAFLGKHIDAITQTVGEILTTFEKGQARVLAVLADERIPEFPDAPTLKEKGIDLVMASNRGIAAPKGTPKEIINYLAEAFKEAMQDPKYIAEMQKLGLPIKYLGPEEFRKLNQKEYEVYSAIAKELK
ncbi:MAG TPA: tripartite tricarboxylate transporter substrate binding protein [Firmicutes bacterium]|nr:tripartite tricarboxylate transporter substrate binding protein [Bacillota bacterium]